MSADEKFRPAFDADYKHKYDFNVTMSCTGCSGAITRVLANSFKPLDDDGKPTVREDKDTGKQDGAFIVNLKNQTVEVWADDVEYNWVYDKIAGTKKKINSGSADGQSQPIA